VPCFIGERLSAVRAKLSKGIKDEVG